MQEHEQAFDIFELTSISIFTLEYIIRQWVCIERKRYKKRGPIIGRLRYLVSPMSIVDLLSIVPFWVVTAFDVILLYHYIIILLYHYFIISYLVNDYS